MKKRLHDGTLLALVGALLWIPFLEYFGYTITDYSTASILCAGFICLATK